MKTLVIATLCCTVLGIWAANLGEAHSQVVTPDQQSPITLAYFGMHIQQDAPWPSVPIGGWRVPVAWKWIEPQKGVWDFKRTDAYVDTARQHGLELLFSLGYSPTWASSKPDQTTAAGAGACAPPRNINDWREHVRVLGRRYKGQVHLYEVWNEPTVGMFWCGSVKDLVSLSKATYEELKAIDPSIQIITPSPVGPAGAGWLNDFFQQGGGKFIDIVGFHFYYSPAPPESLPADIDAVRSVMSRNGQGSKPLWDTEDSWSGTKQDQNSDAAYVARTLLLDRAAGVSRVYWYQWADPTVKLHMVAEDRQTLTPAGNAFRVTQDWLIGAVLKSCDSSDIPKAWHGSNAMWTCDLERDSHIQKIVWNPNGDSPFKVRISWNVNQVRDLAGGSTPLPQSRQITIGSKPVLLVSAQ